MQADAASSDTTSAAGSLEAKGAFRMMIHGSGRGSTVRHKTEPALGTLARRTDLPPRVHKLLDGLLRCSRAYFDKTLPKAFNEVENALFALAERASNNSAQQRHFEALHEFKRGRAGIAQRFLQHVEATLAVLRSEMAAPAGAGTDATTGSHVPLELIEPAAFDEDLALREMAAKSEIRHSQALYMLCYRMAVLAGTPIWPIETVPLGPAQLAAAFRHSMHGLDLAVEARVLAYGHLDRTVMLPVAGLYDAANAYLIERRVLPNLQFQTSYKRGEATREPAATERPAAHAPESASTAQAAVDAGQSPASAGDAALFNTLRSLLGEQRRRDGEDYPVAREHSPAGREDLQSVLGSLQRNTPSTALPSGHQDSEHLKNTLLVKLRRAGPLGKTLRLSEEDADTVDLIGMLFDHIADELDGGEDVRTLFSRLHVPVLRVALNDKTFFTRRDHPARELLNTIAETSSRWMGDSDTDPELVRKMQSVVDHVRSDFDGDIGVFERLLTDLSGHMQALARRANVVERRHIDAARGRDKLETAREAARVEIARILRRANPNRVVRSLLEQAWMDALALSVLRHGADSDEFRSRVAAAERLAQPGAEPANDALLRQELDAGLRQVGVHEDDLPGLLDHAFAPSTPSAEACSRVDDALAGRPRLGGEVARAPIEEAPVPAPLSPVETAQLAQLHKLPFGTWFDFVTNQQGDTARRKLAWYSPVTGRCLFVNARGLRAEDLTLPQLARDMIRGQIRIASAEQTSLIDRAWKAIVGALRPHDAAPAAAGPSHTRAGASA